MNHNEKQNVENVLTTETKTEAYVTENIDAIWE